MKLSSSDKAGICRVIDQHAELFARKWLGHGRLENGVWIAIDSNRGGRSFFHVDIASGQCREGDVQIGGLAEAYARIHNLASDEAYARIAQEIGWTPIDVAPSVAASAPREGRRGDAADAEKRAKILRASLRFAGALVRKWLPEGEQEGEEWRAWDKATHAPIVVNLRTGRAKVGDREMPDLITLFAHLDDGDEVEAWGRMEAELDWAVRHDDRGITSRDGIGSFVTRGPEDMADFGLIAERSGR